MPELPNQAPVENGAQPFTPRRASSVSPLKLVGLGCAVCLLLGVGCAGLMAIFIAKGTTRAKPEAEAYLATFQRGDWEAAWGISHPDLRAEFDEPALGRNLQRIRDVMGPLDSWSMRGTQVNSDSGGNSVTLTYGGTFANGPGTITIVLKGTPESATGYMVHSFHVASPLFDQRVPCPKCGAGSGIGVRFCPECGAAMGAPKGEDGDSDPGG